MSELPRLIGLIGRKGAGKDTVADTLMARGYTNVKFAGALKQMLRTLLGYQGADVATIERMIEGDLKEVPTDYLNGRTPRHAMQTLGEQWGRKQIHSDFWVGTGISRQASVEGPVVITDVRYPNEVEAIVQSGGVVFGITADWIVPVEGEHESEASIDGLIASLGEGNKITNYWSEPDDRPRAIQDFQMRFLLKLKQL